MKILLLTYSSDQKNMKHKILILLGLLVLVLILFKCNSRDGFQFLADQCKNICFDRHPEAARMYADADNDVAMTTIDKCVAECENQRGGSPSCKSCM